jgi:hypothetical protein
MNWIDDAAQEELDDMRSYATRKKCYEESLKGVGEIAGVNAIEDLGEFILKLVRNGTPPDTDWVRRRGRTVCLEHDADPSGSYLTR